MPDDPRLFMRLPPEAAEELYEVFRDQLEGGANYIPPPAALDALQPVRDYLRRLTPAQLEAEYAKFRRRMAAPISCSRDSLRAFAVGGGLPDRTTFNRGMRLG